MEHELHETVAINCFYNKGSTLAENIRYLMYKYNLLINEWHRPLRYLVLQVYQYDDFFVNIDNKYIANDIINLCCQRDNSFHSANYSFSFRIK